MRKIVLIKDPNLQSKRRAKERDGYHVKWNRLRTEHAEQIEADPQQLLGITELKQTRHDKAESRKRKRDAEELFHQKARELDPDGKEGPTWIENERERMRLAGQKRWERLKSDHFIQKA